MYFSPDFYSQIYHFFGSQFFYSLVYSTAYCTKAPIDIDQLPEGICIVFRSHCVVSLTAHSTFLIYSADEQVPESKLDNKSAINKTPTEK